MRRRGAKRVRRYKLLGLLAWRGARQVRRHRFLGLLAWRGWRFYARRRRMAVWLAFVAAIALPGLIRAVRASRRPRVYPPPRPPPRAAQSGLAMTAVSVRIVACSSTCIAAAS